MQRPDPAGVGADQPGNFRSPAGSLRHAEFAADRVFQVADGVAVRCLGEVCRAHGRLLVQARLATRCGCRPHLARPVGERGDIEPVGLSQVRGQGRCDMAAVEHVVGEAELVLLKAPGALAAVAGLGSLRARNRFHVECAGEPVTPGAVPFGTGHAESEIQPRHLDRAEMSCCASQEQGGFPGGPGDTVPQVLRRRFQVHAGPSFLM